MGEFRSHVERALEGEALTDEVALPIFQGMQLSYQFPLPSSSSAVASRSCTIRANDWQAPLPTPFSDPALAAELMTHFTAYQSRNPKRWTNLPEAMTQFVIESYALNALVPSFKANELLVEALKQVEAFTPLYHSSPADLKKIYDSFYFSPLHLEDLIERLFFHMKIGHADLFEIRDKGILAWDNNFFLLCQKQQESVASAAGTGTSSFKARETAQRAQAIALGLIPLMKIIVALHTISAIQIRPPVALDTTTRKSNELKELSDSMIRSSYFNSSVATAFSHSLKFLQLFARSFKMTSHRLDSAAGKQADPTGDMGIWLRYQQILNAYKRGLPRSEPQALLEQFIQAIKKLRFPQDREKFESTLSHYWLAIWPLVKTEKAAADSGLNRAFIIQAYFSDVFDIIIGSYTALLIGNRHASRRRAHIVCTNLLGLSMLDFADTKPIHRQVIQITCDYLKVIAPDHPLKINLNEYTRLLTQPIKAMALVILTKANPQILPVAAYFREEAPQQDFETEIVNKQIAKSSIRELDTLCKQLISSLQPIRRSLSRAISEDKIDPLMVDNLTQMSEQLLHALLPFVINPNLLRLALYHYTVSGLFEYPTPEDNILDLLRTAIHLKACPLSFLEAFGTDWITKALSERTKQRALASSAKATAPEVGSVSSEEESDEEIVLVSTTCHAGASLDTRASLEGIQNASEAAASFMPAVATGKDETPTAHARPTLWLDAETARAIEEKSRRKYVSSSLMPPRVAAAAASAAAGGGSSASQAATSPESESLNASMAEIADLIETRNRIRQSGCETKDLIDWLDENGFEFDHQTGSHAIYRRGGRSISVPHHRIIKPGLLQGLVTRIEEVIRTEAAASAHVEVEVGKVKSGR